jgi:glycosyltransferase involved in cell wall biosynthesis
MNWTELSEDIHQYPIRPTYDGNQISIIIPTYKNVNFLIPCLNSLMYSCENLFEFEILLGIDNCQETLDFVSQNSFFNNENIQIFYFPKNVGPYVIRNTLYKVSKYKNILFFDSDDVMMESSIPKILDRLFSHRIVKFKFYNFTDGTDYLREKLKTSSQIAHGAFAIRSDCFAELNGFFGWKCGADTEFLERYEFFDYDYYKFDEPLFYRRYHGNNITKSKETGINSEFREKYRQYIYKNRKTKGWKNPDKFETFLCSKIIIQ